MRSNRSNIPANSNSESTFRPISAFNERHLSSHVASGSVEDLVSVPVICGGSFMRVVMASMEVDAVVGVQARHGEQLGIYKTIATSCIAGVFFCVSLSR